MYLEIRDVSKTLAKREVLSHISLGMERGRIYGFRGKNGSGKTMLMRVICGLILPTQGEVEIGGEILGKTISFPRSIGALIETPGFISHYSALRNLQTLADIQKKISTHQIREVLLELGLDPDDKKKFRAFSLGMKQKLGIAAAVMENPDIIVLDEPINALDEKSVDTVRNILVRHRERNALIILSCHDREELEGLSDEIFCLEDGRITDHYIVDKGTATPGEAAI